MASSSTNAQAARRFYSSDNLKLKRGKILGMDLKKFNLALSSGHADSPPHAPLSSWCVSHGYAGARKQDVAIMKAHPFFGRLDWEKLLRRELPSPLKQSVEVVSQARQQGRSARHPVNTVDRELAPSYLSRQSSALVRDWDCSARWRRCGGRALDRRGATTRHPAPQSDRGRGSSE